MQVSNLLNPVQSQTGFRASQAAAIPDAIASQKPGGTDITNLSSAEFSFRQILAQYDVSAITPREFSMLAQQLYQARAISADDFQELSQMRALIDQQYSDPDDPVDLTEFFGTQGGGFR